MIFEVLNLVLDEIVQNGIDKVESVQREGVVGNYVIWELVEGIGDVQFGENEILGS